MEISAKQKEFIRFCVVGGLATGIHYGIYLLLNKVMNTTVAFTAGYIISFFANFLLSNYFTFKTKPSTKKGFGFAGSHLINYVLQVALLNLFLYAGIPENIAPLPVYAITIPINFILVRTVLKSQRL
ncbi:GtrA family protein [Tannerella sp.]|uniref:GtrA family protein n=1 Tax=Tannerella sp. TaxID=2382127 RepID=UPI0026DC7DD0|nr:GtrA family protein [Tannerella sp.]MDO4704527.1 GtrA family protein [Tannerella sp.]